jgi:hypothetical protein
MRKRLITIFAVIAVLMVFTISMATPVLAATPTISDVNPTALAAGVTNYPILINGTNFAGATSVSFSGGDITAGVPSVNGAGTQITVTVTIAPSALGTARDVTVNIPGDSGTKTGAFTVIAQIDAYHGASIQKSPLGPTHVPIAHEGDTITASIRITNIDDFNDAITISSITDVVHHSAGNGGDVTSPNLLPSPVIIYSPHDTTPGHEQKYVTVTNTYVVGHDDNNPLTDNAYTAGTDPGIPANPNFTLNYPGSVLIIHPNTLVQISATPSTVNSGDTVTLTITEQNTGNRDLDGPYVVVNQGVGIFNKANLPSGGGDNNSDSKLNGSSPGPAETWTWTKSVVVSSTTTFTATGHGIDPLGLDITPANSHLPYLDFSGEQWSTTVQVRETPPPPNVPASSNASLFVLIGGFAAAMGLFISWKMRKSQI